VPARKRWKWPDLRERTLVCEIMDDPALPHDQLASALQGLSRLNRLSQSWRVFLPALRDASRSALSLRVLDVASGAGDNLAHLLKACNRERLYIEPFACDINPAMVRATDQALSAVGQMTRDSFQNSPRTFVHDVVQHDLPHEYDIVLNALFLHHLSRDHAVVVLARMAKAARTAVVVSDLVRTPWAWLQVALASRALTRSHVVHVDALRSIYAAWTPRELLSLAHDAGLHGARITSAPPARMLMVWQRPASGATP